uniref:M-phase inducer phosphatase 2-like isoform X3 n=1 Tax=Agelaius phoeniceus TaxID=39638 RepID=UPI0023EBF472|nr:M-phase inducer phosphatase 2-like isoform X3 [Agelaius phoeniceus]
MSLRGGRGLPVSPLPSPGTAPLTPLPPDGAESPDRYRDTPRRGRGRLWHPLAPEPLASDRPRHSVSWQPRDAGSGPDSHTQQSPAQEDFQKTIAEFGRALKDRKLLRQRISSLPQGQLEASPVLKDISQLQVRRGRVRQSEPEDEEGFVPKKLQRLGQRSRLPAGHGAARRDLLAKSPSGAPELLLPLWQSDATVPQGMEKPVTTPVIKKEEAKLRPGKRGQGRQLFRSPSVPGSVTERLPKRGLRSDGDSPANAQRQSRMAGSPEQEAALEPVGDGEGAGAEPACGWQDCARAPADIWGCLWSVPPQGAWLEPCRSAQLQEIENLLANDDQELIGDFSKPHLLPTVEGKDPGLKYISPETVRGQRPSRSPPRGCLPVPGPVCPLLVTRSPRSWWRCCREATAASSGAASLWIAGTPTSTREATSRSECPHRGPGAGRKGGYPSPNQPQRC